MSISCSGEVRRVFPVAAVAVFLSVLVALPGGANTNPFPAEWFWGDAAQRKQQDAMIGRPMPDLWLSDWINGPLTKEDMRGKVLVVDFWATWCGPCIRSIPKNNDLAAKYADQDVLVIGVCTSSRGQEKMASVAKRHDIRYPTAKDPSQRSSKAWRVMWFPTYAVVDRKGMVRAVGLQPSYVENVVAQILKEQPKQEAVEEDDATEEEVVELDYEPLPAELLEGTEQQRFRLTGLEGAEPPPLRVQGWINADGISTEKLKGKVVLIDFWATWCGPCIEAIPKTNELQRKYGKDGLVVLGICNTRGAGKMPATVRKERIKFPVAADIDHATSDAYRVNGYPDYYLIDRAGFLRAADVRNDKVEEAIQLLLAEPVPEEEMEEEAAEDAVAQAE